MEILSKKILNEALSTRVTQVEISAPLIAQKAQPGQFVVLMVSAQGERIPLTIVAANLPRQSITLIFQETGFTTRLLGKMPVGGSLYSLVGPLGHPTEIKNYGKVILVGGGVGIAEIYPVAKGFQAAGNHLTAILGARTKKLLILEEQLKSASQEFYITTDDGSSGRKGFVTDVLADLLKRGRYDLAYAVGPIPMMSMVANTTKDYNLKTIVSLNALMVDGTGMCGCCRVTIGGETKFSCVDGPEFNARDVDWDELAKRNRIYCAKEKHICQLEK